MSGGLYACWECGRAAPSGACMGPHEGFSLASAVNRGHVRFIGQREATAYALACANEAPARLELGRIERMRMRALLAVAGRRAS